MNFEDLITLRQTYDNAVCEHGEAAFAAYLQEVRREYGFPVFVVRIVIGKDGIAIQDNATAAILFDWQDIIRDILGEGDWTFEVDEAGVRRTGTETVRERATAQIEGKAGLIGISFEPDAANEDGTRS